MGCDIHGWIEKKVNGKWIAIRELRDEGRERHYIRFAALAGVRGRGPSARGLPKDISDTCAYAAEGWGTDGHSHSWLPLLEAVDIYHKSRYDQETRDDFMEKYPSEHFFGITAGPERRLVFWFDN